MLYIMIHVITIMEFIDEKLKLNFYLFTNYIYYLLKYLVTYKLIAY